MNIGRFFPWIFMENNDWWQLCHENFHRKLWISAACFREFFTENNDFPCRLAANLSGNQTVRRQTNTRQSSCRLVNWG